MCLLLCMLFNDYLSQIKIISYNCLLNSTTHLAQYRVRLLITFICSEARFESSVLPKTQYNGPGQCSYLDYFIQSPTHTTGPHLYYTNISAVNGDKILNYSNVVSNLNYLSLKGIVIKPDKLSQT